MAKKVKTQYVCQTCGYCSPGWMGKCPECDSWNGSVEEILSTGQNKTSTKRAMGKKPVALTDIEPIAETREKIGLRYPFE